MALRNKLKRFLARLQGRPAYQVDMQLCGDVSLAEYEEACVLLGLDPDEAHTGEYVRKNIEWQGSDAAQHFVNIALTNGSDFDLSHDFSRRGAEEFVGTVAAFFFAAHMPISSELSDWRTMWQNAQKLNSTLQEQAASPSGRDSHVA